MMGNRWVARARGALLALVAAAAGNAAIAAEPSQQPLPKPDLAITTTGWIGALARQSDGSVIVGGDFIAVNGVRRRNLARIRADGTLDPQWNPAPDGVTVDALAVDSQDRVYVAGSFERIGGAARSNLARLDGHGSGAADANWQVAGALGVSLLAVDNDALYVGGGFDTIAGEPRNGLARIRASGTLDPDWDPQPDAADISALALEGDRLYVAGSFRSIDGVARNGLARLSALSGALDPAWNPAPEPDGSEDPEYQGVAAIAAHEGRVYVGGTFRRIAHADRDNLAVLSGVDGSAMAFGASDISPVYRLARDGNGAIYVLASDGHAIRRLDEISGEDRAFAAPQVQVKAMVADGDRVTLGGYFDTAPGRDDVSLMQRRPDGTPDGVTWKIDLAGYVQAVQVLHDDSVVFGGNFRRVDGLPRHGLARVFADGTLDANFDLAVDGTGSVGATVSALAEDAQGRIYIVGQWQRGGVLGRVARVDANGALDEAWSPQPDGTVANIALDGADVFLTGDFRRIGAVTRNGLAKLGNGSGAPLDPDWDPQPMWSGSAGFAYGIVATAGSVYVTGHFDVIGGVPRAGVARLERSGIGATMPWNPQVDHRIDAMQAVGDAMILAGAFSHVGSEVRNGLAKVSLYGDGAVQGWNPLGGTPARFVAIAPADNGAWYAYGWRDVADPDAVAVLRIEDAGVDEAWRVQVGDIQYTLQTIAGNGDGRLYLGGSFDRVGDRCRLSLAAVDAHVDAGVAGERVFADGFEMSCR